MDIGLQTRREFFVRAAQTGAVVAFSGVLSSILAACGGSGNNPGDVPTLPTIQGTVTNNTITISTASGSPIAAVGSAALIQYSNGYLLVAHTATSTFSVLSGICTHQGCIVNGFSAGIFSCPCHGSEFDLNGGVIHGPATAPLQKFASQVANNQLVITV
ncbi:MAG TPA: Rieske (2Fe-2S) protein [Bacteroidota bacterium]|nr:Rieske (2Fe-2S) protein [Bacteroidota bacterium]